MPPAAPVTMMTLPSSGWVIPRLALAVLIFYAEVCAIFSCRRYLPAVQLGDGFRLLKHVDVGCELLIAIGVAPHGVLQPHPAIDTEHGGEGRQIQGRPSGGAYGDDGCRVDLTDLLDHQSLMSEQVARIGD